MTFLALRKEDPRVELGAWLYETGLAEYARCRHGDVPGVVVVRPQDLAGVTQALRGRLFGAQIMVLPHGGPLAGEVWLAPPAGEVGG